MAAVIPIGTATSSARSCEEPMTKSVVGTRSRISRSTSTRLAKEKPQSPCAIAASQRR
jgi:hypothetical protein